MKINRLLIVMLALLLPSLLLTGVADAAPRAVTSSLAHVSGTQYGDDIGIAWSFDGRPAQYPRLHTELVCWYSQDDVNDFSKPIAYGNVVYLDAYSVDALYPGSGVTYFWTDSGGISPWTNTPGDVWCKASLLDWTTKGIRNQEARFHQTIYLKLEDPRTP